MLLEHLPVLIRKKKIFLLYIKKLKSLWGKKNWNLYSSHYKCWNLIPNLSLRYQVFIDKNGMQFLVTLFCAKIPRRPDRFLKRCHTCHHKQTKKYRSFWENLLKLEFLMDCRQKIRGKRKILVTLTSRATRTACKKVGTVPLPYRQRWLGSVMVGR